jgi:curved DNA-binding protein CbpA
MSNVKKLIKLANIFDLKLKKIAHKVTSMPEALRILNFEDAEYQELKENPDLLRKRYRELSKIYHPDRGGKEGDFIKLTNALEFLNQAIDRGVSYFSSGSESSASSYETIDERRKRLKKEELAADVAEIRRRREEMLKGNSPKPEPRPTDQHHHAHHTPRENVSSSQTSERSEPENIYRFIPGESRDDRERRITRERLQREVDELRRRRSQIK